MLLLVASLWLQVRVGVPPSGTTSGDTTPPPPLSVAEAAQRFALTIRTVPETATVGQHVAVTVTVHVSPALAAQVRFPHGADSTSQELMSSFGTPRYAQQKGADGSTALSATYEVAPWDVGTVPLGLGELVIGTTHISLGDATLAVRSVLPKDSATLAKVKPKDARPIFPLTTIIKRAVKKTVQAVKNDYRLLIATIVAALLLLAGIVALWLRRRRRIRESMPFDWIRWAEDEFKRIEALHLVEKGKPEEYAIRMTDVLRKTLVHQFPSILASATTREMVAGLQREPTIPAKRTLALFERVDVLKFAGLDAETTEAQAVGAEDQVILREIKGNLDEERRAREAEAAAQARTKGKSRGTMKETAPKQAKTTTRRGAP